MGFCQDAAGDVVDASDDFEQVVRLPSVKPLQQEQVTLHDHELGAPQGCDSVELVARTSGSQQQLTASGGSSGRAFVKVSPPRDDEGIATPVALQHAEAEPAAPSARSTRSRSETSSADPDYTFTIVLTRAKGEKLGIGVRAEHCINALRVDDVAGDSVVSRWNEGHPDSALKAGDYLIQVNGRCETWEMSRECRHRRNLVVVVKRHAKPIGSGPPSVCSAPRGSATNRATHGDH